MVRDPDLAAAAARTSEGFGAGVSPAKPAKLRRMSKFNDLVFKPVTEAILLTLQLVTRLKVHPESLTRPKEAGQP